MSRRGRALVFAFSAVVTAAIAAVVANGYGTRALHGYGPLRPVVVVVAKIAAGARLDPSRVASHLGVRRVPVRFAPSGSLLAPEEALGLVARTPLPAGSYLLGSQLAPPARQAPRARSLGGGRRPVEISVSGAAALLASRSARRGASVDVVVTTEPRGVGAGRTYVAAAHVPLLALRPEGEDVGPGAIAEATLGLTRNQALRLIAAESFARKVTLLPEG